VHPSPPAADGTVLSVSPAAAGWGYVGFEVLRLSEGVSAERDCGDRELCVVVVAGTAEVSCEHGEWAGLGGRTDPWSGPPEGAYVPPGSHVRLSGNGEVALCWAPAVNGGAPARRLGSDGVAVEVRGYGDQERTVAPILMADREADALLVCEVLTPGGNWSSYPPHKHDVDNPPAETLLEETYYHRLRRPEGFALQRVYTSDRTLDETLSCGDGDCVLVPRGFHTVSAPPGYDLYYLNVMAGPLRQWAVVNDPDYEWRIAPPNPVM